MKPTFALLGALALASPVVIPLAGCQTNMSTQTQVQYLSGLGTAGIDGVSLVMLAKPGLIASTASKVAALQKTVDDANAIIQKAPITLPSNAQTLAGAIKDAAAVLIPLLPANSDEALAANAAMAILPVLLAAAGAPVPPPTAAMAPGTVVMPPDQATAFLHQWTGK